MLTVGTTLDIGDHTVEVRETPLQTGDRYRLRIVAQPGGPGIKGDFAHVHPILLETFPCVSGDMVVRAGKQVAPLPPGETAEVPPGLVHGFLNTGASPLVVDSALVFVDGYAPEDDLLRFAGIYDRLRRDGATADDTPQEPPMLQMAVLSHSYRRVIRQPGVAGLLMPALAAVGRARGYHRDLPEHERGG